jgi:hypothetical protein
MRFELVIPTRSSARWVLRFLEAYRSLGIEPFYVVDVRSDDGTEALLRSAGARLASYEPKANFVEAGMIEFASRSVKRDWSLRMNDDEFPSRMLLSWAEEIGCLSDKVHWTLSRRELLRHDSEIKYSQLESHYHAGTIITLAPIRNF